jgi:DNA-binding transcriptional regulator LsrR (DeoR family)
MIVNFSSGTSKTVKVRIYGDTTYEQNEHAFVNLGPSSQVAFEDRRGLLTILNDDGNTASGTVSDGYIDGATVFLDANRNGVRDYLDLNRNGAQDAGEPDEPSAISGADGSFAIAVLPAFDLNGNGQYDTDEGSIVATGGVDTSTLQPLAYPLTAPAGSSAVTPLTTLLVGLTEDYGLTLVEAEARLQAAFGLPAVRITETDAIADALESSTVGAEVFAAAAQVHDTVVQTANLLATTGGSSAEGAAQAALGAIAALLAGVNANGSLSLADDAAVQSIVSGAAATTNVSLAPAVTLAAATVIATSNQAIAEISVAGSADFLADVVRVQQVAQTTVAADLALLGAGALAPQDAIDRNTSAALASQIATAPVANIAPPRISIDAPQMSEGNADGQMTFAIRLSAASAVPVAVSYVTVDGTAMAADEDYVPSAGIVEFVPGEVERLVSITVRGDMAAELDEYFLVELSDPAGGVISAAVGVGTITDDDSLDVTPPESAVLPLDLLQCSPAFDLTVLAVDEFEESAAGNSGVASVEVYVSANGGPFELWIALPEGVSIATFVPQPNTEYAFYSIARDRAGNIEPPPHQASATTRMTLVTPGDANCDGAVNRIDAAIVARNFGRDFDANWNLGDFNGDRRVDLHDLAIVQGRLTLSGPGDANGDGGVDRRDLAMVTGNFGKSADAVWADGDFNGDGGVGVADAVIWRANASREPARAGAALAAVASRRSPVELRAARRPRGLAIPNQRSARLEAVDQVHGESTGGAHMRASRPRDTRDPQEDRQFANRDHSQIPESLGREAELAE